MIAQLKRLPLLVALFAVAVSSVAGEATASDASRPVAASVEALAAGGGQHFASHSHVCAVVAGGLQCWGAGESGQLGRGMLPRRSPHPVAVYPPGSGVTDVAAGRVHSCAVVAGRVFCWGTNAGGQGGAARPFVLTRPRAVAGPTGTATRVAAGGDHSCAIAGGEVWCWGRNEFGQSAATACDAAAAKGSCSVAPTRVAGLGGTPRALALGRRHTCVSTETALQCFGANASGQLGDGAAQARRVPAAVAGLPAEIDAIAAGDAHSCALAGGRLYCWGANTHGQLGDGTTTARSSPSVVTALPGPVVAVAAGAAHTCAATANGVFCWGDGREGQLDGSIRPQPTTSPVAVPALAGPISRLAAGRDNSCAVGPGARVQCWGDDDFGQLGAIDPAPPPGRTPRRAARAVRWDDGRLHDRNGDGRITVGCLGDSNTRSRHTADNGWCERLAGFAPPEGWSFLNRGEGGATAMSMRSLILADEHLDYTLENDAVDAVILAYGTNDLLVAKGTPSEIVTALLLLRQRAHEHGVEVFVALLPPGVASARGALAGVPAVNAAIREAIPASRIVDFETGMTDDDLVDGVHFGASGHEKRARAAWAALSAAAGGVPDAKPSTASEPSVQATEAR